MMNRLNTRLALPALAATLALSYACSIPSTGACKADTDCSGGAQCIEGICTGGELPTAAITAPAEVALGSVVTLDGANSTRADGSKEGLSYSWSVISPANVTLTGPDSATPTFTASLPKETYRIQLVVSDKGTPSAAVTQDIKVANSKPVAAVTTTLELWDRDVDVPLSAATSTDPDGDTLTYAWNLVKDPTTAAGTLTPNGATATLRTGTTAASYSVSVTVSDGALSDTATLTRAINNSPPVVTLDAAAVTSVGHTCTNPGGGVTCEATGQLTITATDPDGSIELSTLAWALRSAPPAANAQVTFTPVSDQGLTSSFRISNGGTSAIAGTYEFGASVADNDGTVTTLVIPITVTNGLPVPATVEGTVFEADHVYDAANTAWKAEFALPVGTSDPDGDSVTVTFQTPTVNVPALDGVATFTFTGTGVDQVLTVSAPATAAADLVNGGSPSVSVVAVHTDVNGGITNARYDLKIKNRAPTLAGYVNKTVTGHTYGVLAAAGTTAGYHTNFDFGTALVAADLDGDPVVVTYTVADIGSPVQVLPGTPSSPRAVILFSTSATIVDRNLNVTAKASDGAATTEVARVLKMTNRAPTVTGFVGQTSTQHTFVTGGSYEHTFTFTPAVAVADPDGDPLVATWIGAPMNDGTAYTVAAAGVGPATAPTGVKLTSPRPHGVGRNLAIGYSVADGIAAAVVTTQTFLIGNRSPVITNFNDQTLPGHTYGVPSGVTPAPPAGYHGTFTFPQPLTATDPDGDPLTGGITFTLAPIGATVTLLATGGANPLTLRLYSTSTLLVERDLSVTAQADDGFRQTAGDGTTRTLRMNNRAPVINSSSATPNGSCGVQQSACVQCARGGLACDTNAQLNVIPLYTPTLAATATDPDGDPVTVTWSTTGGPNVVYANFFLTEPVMNCTSGVACPTINNINLGRNLMTLGINTCTGTTNRRTAAQVTNIVRVAGDSIGTYSGAQPAVVSTPMTFQGVTSLINCPAVIDPGGGGQSG